MLLLLFVLLLLSMMVVLVLRRRQTPVRTKVNLVPQLRAEAQSATLAVERANADVQKLSATQLEVQQLRSELETIKAAYDDEVKVAQSAGGGILIRRCVEG